MAITIQEIFASDTISKMVERINFNFDQLILAGGGPRGIQGIQGVSGPSGPTGRRGENIYFDDGTGIGSAPTTNVIVGDNFVLANGDVYEWDGILWILTGTNIRGPIGLTGPSGASLDFDRYAGGFDSTFPITLSYYPQNPPTTIPTPNAKDFITLKRGGIDILYLGDANETYGTSGADSGISNMPPQPNSAKLWVIQDDIVGGGKNGITIGSKNAKNSFDNPNTYANYEQFAHLYIGSDGSFNISMTAGGITEPKPINISSDLKIDLNAGDVINNHLFVGLDTSDSLIGMYGTLKDKIDLTTTNTYFKTRENIEFEVDNDLNGTGIFSITKNTFSIVNPSNQNRVTTIQIPNLTVSNDTNHYSEGLSIYDSTNLKSVKLEMFKFGLKTYATLGISNTVDEGKNFMISSDGVSLISPKVSYPLNPISTWISDPVNTSIGDGSLSVYRKIRMKNTGGTLTGGLVFSDSNGVFDYASATIGIPGNNTDYVIGLWGREVALNRTYLALRDDFINLGDRTTDSSNSMLVISKARASRGGTTRDAKILMITETITDTPKIVFKNGFETTLSSIETVNANRTQKLPKSVGAGGVLMSFSDNAGQYDDAWEEYQVLVNENVVPFGSAKLKNDIKFNAFGADTPSSALIIDPVQLNRFVITSGVENYLYGTTGTAFERRFPSKIHIKRINRDFYIINFSIGLYIKQLDITMPYDDFNFFDFTFNTKNPGVLKPMRNNINSFDPVGGVWFSGSAYQTGMTYSATGDGAPTNYPSISPTGLYDARRILVTDTPSYARLRFNSQITYPMTWTVDKISTDRFRLQISVASNITKAILRNGMMFTGSAIVYGYRDTDV